MSGIFKKITDKNITPFKAFKQNNIDYDLNNDTEVDGVRVLKAEYSGQFIYNDLNDPNLESQWFSNSQFFFNHIYSNFYKGYTKNRLSKLGETNIYQVRELHEKNTIISIPKELYGEEIKKNSVLLDFSGGATGSYQNVFNDLGFTSDGIVYDSTDNNLDALLRQSNSLSVTNGSTLTLAIDISTYTVTNQGSATPTINTNSITFNTGDVYNLQIFNAGVLTYWFPCSEGSGNNLTDVKSSTFGLIDNHTWINQNLFHYNISSGSININSGSVYIPHDTTGTTIPSASALPYFDFDNETGYGFIDVETKVELNPNNDNGLANYQNLTASQYLDYNELKTYFDTKDNLSYDISGSYTLVNVNTNDEDSDVGPLYDDGYGNLIDKSKYDTVFPTIGNPRDDLLLYYNFDITFLGTDELPDSSIFNNNAKGYNVESATSYLGIYGKKLRFNGTNSHVQTLHNEIFNINDDFAISFLMTTPSTTVVNSTLFTKNGGYTKFKEVRTDNDGKLSYNLEPSHQNLDTIYPFNIEFNNNIIEFSRYDGTNLVTLSSSALSTESNYHILCQKVGDNLQLIVNGTLLDEQVDTTRNISNICDLFLGMKGDFTNYYTGDLDEIKIYEKSFNEEEYLILAEGESTGASNYVIGNVFYELGLIIVFTPLNDIRRYFNNWILVSGFWEDKNIWIDTEKWNDYI